MQRFSHTLTVLFMFSALFFVFGCDSADNQKDCVVMLGDSIFDYTDQETKFLEELSGSTYRHYYISGAELTGGLVDSIPEQYQKAINDGPIRTVIMDGGGNDVLIGGLSQCSTVYGTALPQACLDILDEVSATTEQLLLQLAADGVQNVIWQGYYHTTNPLLWQVTEYTNELMKQGLAEFQAEFPYMKVIFIDVQPHFNKNYAAYYTLIDGIHPDTDASEDLATLVWNAMVSNNIEQGTSCD